jgi:protocatechuate 3,4-dioxygenase alpha subunit
MTDHQLGPTPSQTVGPFLSLVLPWADGSDVVAPGTPGLITIVGRVTDGESSPVPDGIVEIWQADPEGRFAGTGTDPSRTADFRGFGRCATDAAGEYVFRTLRPGPLPAEDGLVEAPHVDVSVFARGLLNRVVTRIYFPGDPANDADPVLASLPAGTRPLLIASAEDVDTLRFDIRLQGEDETPFFDL